MMICTRRRSAHCPDWRSPHIEDLSSDPQLEEHKGKRLVELSVHEYATNDLSSTVKDALELLDRAKYLRFPKE